jgi:hypothetical protein
MQNDKTIKENEKKKNNLYPYQFLKLMIRVIRSMAREMKKPQNPILNNPNAE